MTEPLLRVRNLVKQFLVKRGIFSGAAERVHAVNGVSFELDAGETLGLVGESGCGKSTTGRCILRLTEPSSGEVWFKGTNVTALNRTELRALCRDMQIIFQDPYASLDPRMTIGAIIGEALTIHRLVKSHRQFVDRIVELLETVGLHADHMWRYPHEFSGGQRQRIGEVARVCDLYSAPLHPYTEALLSAVPIPDPAVKRRRIVLTGDVPGALRLPSGCPFHSRCPIRQLPLCVDETPELKSSGNGHWVACHLRG